MTLQSLLVHDVTIVTPLFIEDRYGNAEKSWDNAEERTVKGWVSQRTQTEDRDHREAAVSDWILFLEPDEIVSSLDRIQWGGITFETDGPYNPAWSPRGVHHIEVPLRVVTG